MTEAPEAPPLPTVKELVRAIAISLVVAAIVLISTVLPAEFAVDPTGLGGRLGLMRPKAEAQDAVPTAPNTVEVPSDRVLAKAPVAFRTDETTLTLASGKGAEIKASMRRHGRFVFSWTADGPVDFDMHGEATNASRGEYTSYWKDEGQASGHGAFEAPFHGTHGWFWQNLTEESVTIRLKTSGYYQKIGPPTP